MADITINFSAEKLARVQSAFGKYLNTTDGNGTVIPATEAQIGAYFKEEIKRITKNIERQSAEAAINVADL